MPFKCLHSTGANTRRLEPNSDLTHVILLVTMPPTSWPQPCSDLTNTFTSVVVRVVYRLLAPFADCGVGGNVQTRVCCP